MATAILGLPNCVTTELPSSSDFHIGERLFARKSPVIDAASDPYYRHSSPLGTFWGVGLKSHGVTVRFCGTIGN